MRWVKLGDYIEQCDDRNVENMDYPFIGINKDKEFMPTVANISGIDKQNYKIVKKGLFVFSGMQTGRDECIRISLYEHEKEALISPAYTIFKVKLNKGLLPEFLFMYFKRKEMDRYGWFISDSSIRSNLDWPRFLDIKIPLPGMAEQKKLVAVWKGLKNLKENNEKMAEPLLSLCQSYLKELKHKYPSIKISKLIKLHDIFNDNGYKYPIMGINKDKEFMPTVASIKNLDIKKYKVVKDNIFVFSGMQTGRDECIRISLYNQPQAIIVSPAYATFKLMKNNIILPDFFFLCFKRKEMDRYGWFISDSSVRSNLDWPRFMDIKIPMPPIEIQQAIVNMYNCAKEAKEIAKNADNLIKDLCPALMRKAAGGKYNAKR